VNDLDEPTVRAFATTRWAAVQLAKLAFVALLSATVFAAPRGGIVNPLEPTLTLVVLAIGTFGLVFLGPAVHLALLRRWRAASPARFRVLAIASTPLAGLATVTNFFTYGGELLLVPWLVSVVLYGAWVSRPPLVTRPTRARFRDGKYVPFG
jgi:hypothetical protein